MNKNEAEKIINDTILYANNEIERSKKKYLKISFIIVGVIIFLFGLYIFIFKYEIPVKYNNKLINVNIPLDGGLDVSVNLDNYKIVKAVLVKVGDDNYDLYINVTSTIFTSVVADNDKTDNFLRVGNGIIIDYNSGELRGYMPNGKKAESIKNVYYVDNLSNYMITNADTELVNYENRILVWER